VGSGKTEGRVQRAAKFARANIDTLLAIVAAAVFFVLDLFSVVDTTTVSSATLALLGVVAFVLLRDRGEREALFGSRQHLDRVLAGLEPSLSELDDLKQIAEDALCELPYEVLSQTCEWDISSRDRSVAITTLRVRFIRGYISTMENWCRGSGKLEEWQGFWKFPRDAGWNEAEAIHEDGDVDGGTKKIFALDREHSRNDVIDWRVRRVAVGRFPKSSESVSLQPLAPEADHPRRLRVVWPADRPPASVSLRYGQQETIALRPSRTEDDPPRALVEQEINDLVRHGRVQVTWIWGAGAG
jgi:hypothetical protein